ncbi:ClpP [Corchorus capsularis]|uniref:ATP-dependent Clp protease proteolytic subunit n=1 Tax=Corchorus capsularis TaxID=210143 RepID=A0A1R3IVY1_COCAP|nr:ClpP [Corchorus capsularis]
MSSCLHAPMPYTVSSSAFSQSIRRPKTLKLGCRAFGVKCAAKIPMPPINPNDSFLQKLASLVASSPETLLNRPVKADTLPFMDVLDSDVYDCPKLMATPAELERSANYREHRTRRPPPDLPSMLLHGRIVYIGMPLVPAVTELVIAQLMYLQYMDRDQPIYLYINSTGTTRGDGEPVALETEGFAIYDALMLSKCQIHTLCLGSAFGQACLLLAAGTKGKRFMMPNATAMIQQPRIPSTGLMPASDVLIRTRETIILRDAFVELFAKHTGNSEETVANVMRAGPYSMDGAKAKEFGVIDKIYWRGQEQLMAEIASPEDWDKNAGIKDMDDF